MISLLFLLSHLTSTTYAYPPFVGDNLDYARERSNPFACEVIISNSVTTPDGSIVDGHCSGTLVSANQVFTAGHCFGRFFDLSRHPVSVSCGGKTQRVGGVTPPDSNNNSLWLNNLEPVRSEDFAVINLSSSASVSAMTAARNGSPYFDAQGQLISGVTCRMLGYGLTDLSVDEDGNLGIGQLVEAKLDSRTVIQYSASAKAITLTPRNGATLVTSVNGGDSGGSLLCTAPGHNEELLGVIILKRAASAGDNIHASMNLINPIWFHFQN